MELKPCPHCFSKKPEEAAYCFSCTRLVHESIACEHCAEPIAVKASRCPYCTQKVPKRGHQKLADISMEVTAHRFGAFLTGGNITSLFKPPVIIVRDGKIMVSKWSFFGLRTHQAEISVDRVASVRYTRGVIWGGILVETFGGAAEDMKEGGLPQEDAKMLADRLKSVISD